MQIRPDWFYGLIQPPGWLPDRPREPYFVEQDVLNIAANTTAVKDTIFSKQYDVLVFGGVALVSLETGVAFGAQQIVVPRNNAAGATPSQKLVRLSQPSAQKTFMERFSNIGPGGSSIRDTGFVPLENIFSSWQSVYGTPGQEPVFWPIPIPVSRGASLLVETQNLSQTQTHSVRYTFLCALIYDRETATPATQAAA